MSKEKPIKNPWFFITYLLISECSDGDTKAFGVSKMH